MNVYCDKMTKEITLSEAEVNAGLEWAKFVYNNLDEFRGFLDFGFKFLEKARLISSHWDEAEMFSDFVRYSIASLIDVAHNAGDDVRAAQIEKEDLKEPKRDNPWTEAQAFNEWRNFVKKNGNEFKDFIGFLRELSKQAKSIDEKYRVNLYSKFAKEMSNYAEIVEMQISL